MKKLLIAGCSHAAGCEIDGNMDSNFNRSKSFGGTLASLLDIESINISISGASNSRISRSILEWFKINNYPTDVYVLVCWTDSARMEFPSMIKNHHAYQINSMIDWIPPSLLDFFEITQNTFNSKSTTTENINFYKKFIKNNNLFLEIQTANLILQIQYFFTAHNIKYIMCNSMYLFSDNEILNHYKELIDKKRYFNFDNNEESFYWKYKKLNYENKNGNYLHHDEVPHTLYAKELFKFISDYKLID